MTKKKTALFLACGTIYDDKWPSVCNTLTTAAQVLRDASYALCEDFGDHEISCADPLRATMDPLMTPCEILDDFDYDRTAAFYAKLLGLEHAKKVVALCDLSKDDQVDNLRAILSACRTCGIAAQSVLYDADDWTC